MSTAPNPYATPRAVVADAGVAPAVEAARREHLNHEANIKAAGGIFMLGGLFTLFAALAVIAPLLTDARGGAGMLAIGFVMAALAAGGVAAGWGLRMLRSWARIPGIVLAVLGLFAFPVGTLINGYVLWLLASRKGRMVLSAEYAAVMAATPHIRYRTPVVVWIVLGALVVLIVFAVVAGLPRG